MKYTTYRTANAVDNPHGVEVKRLYDMPSAEVMHVTLRPGEALKRHKTPGDVFFYVLEGTPTIHLGTESEIFEKDTLIEGPANVGCNIGNDGSSVVRILVIKAPKPTTSTK